jgi:hypothetical protein
MPAYQSYPPSLWAQPESDGRESASNGDSFTDAAITASDATNAAKLAGLGFIADPATAWVVGEFMTVNTFAFHWDGIAWVAGAVPVEEPAPETEPEPEPTTEPTEPYSEPQEAP